MDKSRSYVSPSLDAFLAEILYDRHPASAAEFAAAILDEPNPASAAEFAAKILREYNYNPDEPRDEKGRWTTGGSHGGRPNAIMNGVPAPSPINVIDPAGLRKDTTGSWVWPWDPNASWNPIDTARLWIGGINDATLKPIAREMWEIVIDKELKPMGYDAAAMLLSHSLQDNPSDLHIPPSHFISKEIAASAEYKAAKKQILDSLSPRTSVKGSVTVAFDEGDLFAAFHLATMDYTASKDKDGRVTSFHATIKDKFDFDLQVRRYYRAHGKKWLAVVANNMAWSDQFFGVIHNYDIEAEIE
jgi:hypothetical protein